MFKKIAVLLGLVIFFAVAPANAQGGPPSTAEQFSYASSTTVTTSASSVTLGASTAVHVKGVLVIAPATNADIIYVSDNVTTTATTSTLPILPGTSVMLTYNQLAISVIAASGTQAVRFVVYYK